MILYIIYIRIEDSFALFYQDICVYLVTKYLFFHQMLVITRLYYIITINLLKLNLTLLKLHTLK